jgi:hypothetical protein
VPLKSPFRVALAVLAIAVPLAGCGGGGGVGDDRATVEAGLQHFFSTLDPEDSIFPYGAGAPRVKDNGCKDLHQKFPLLPPSTKLLPGPIRLPPGPIKLPPRSTKFKNAKKVALWQCSVRFNNFTLRVTVAVNDSSEVVWALPVYGDARKAPKLSPARTYTG